MTNKEISKLMSERVKYKIECVCGHRMAIANNKDFIICSWCGRKVLNKRKIFKEEILKRLKG